MIPKIIWFYWHQGLDDSPFVVRRCLRSWVETNPDWIVEVLDAERIGRFVQPALPQQVRDTLCLAHRSDLIRLQLLRSYGGVWADATTLCVRPLDDWLEQAARSGFFAFDRPGRDRLIANWFLAAEQGCPIVIRLEQILTDYWIEHPWRAAEGKRRTMERLLASALNRSVCTTRLWFHPWVSDRLKLTPYFIFHYLFAILVARDDTCRQIWRGTPRLSARPARLIEQLGFHTAVTVAIERQLKESRATLYKLSWKYDHSRYNKGSVLHRLLEERV